MHKITLIKGDGIGLEVTKGAKKVIDSLGLDIVWDEVEAGESVIQEYKTPLPEYVLDSIRENKIALKGPITTPVGGGFKSVNVTLRQNLNLYANVRPVKSFDGIKSRYEDIDLIIVRENSEDLYVGIEKMISEDEAHSIKVITKKASNRICEYAFDLARKQNRKKVSAVHKANILKLSDGLFLRCAKEVASLNKEIEFEDVIIDAMCMKLVMNPNKYDVLVMPNLYGDILSDMCAGFVGGLGLLASANIGDDVAIFEPVHGSAPDIAGKNIANPIACILSSAMMLKHIGYIDEGFKVEDAVKKVIKEGKVLTLDLGGKASTDEIVDEIIKNLN